MKGSRFSIGALRQFAVDFAYSKLSQLPTDVSLGVSEEDLAQIALIDYHRNWHESICHPKAFIGQSIKREIARIMRAKRTHFQGLPLNVVEIGDERPSAEQLMARQEDIERVREVLDFIKEKKPQVYEYAQLILTDEASQRGQIATALGVPGWRIDYLKELLRKEVERYVAMKTANGHSAERANDD